MVGGDWERGRWGVGAEVVDLESSGSEQVGEDEPGVQAILEESRRLTRTFENIAKLC